MNGHVRSCKYLHTKNRDDCWCEAVRYWRAFWITVVIVIAEIAGGLISESLSLLSDALHAFIDGSHIGVSLFVVYLSKQIVEKEQYYRRVGAYVGLVLLVLGGIWIFFEAIERFENPREVLGSVMFTIATLGLLGNIIVLRMLHAVPHKDHTITHTIFTAHVLSDMLLSVAVVISSLIIWFTSHTLVDPIMSMCVAVYMLFWLSPKVIKEIHSNHFHHH